MSAAKLIVPLSVVLILGWVTVMTVTHDERLAASGCPGHWHTSFDVYVSGQRVGFPKPPYSLSGESPGSKLPFRMHMHAKDNGNIFHYEPNNPSGDRCLGLEGTFGLLDVNLNSNSLVLSGSAHGVADGTYPVDANHTLRVFILNPDTHWETVQDQPYELFDSYKPWEEMTMSQALDIRQMPNYSKVLIVYGNETDEQVTTWKNAIPNPPGVEGVGFS